MHVRMLYSRQFSDLIANSPTGNPKSIIEVNRVRTVREKLSYSTLRCSLINPPVRTRPTHFSEHTTRPFDEHAGRVELEHLPGAEHHDTVVVQDSPEPVRDRDDDRPGELFPDRALYLCRNALC